MASVVVPQRKSQGLGEIGMIGGAIVGGLVGGPGGAVTGAQVGGAAGGMMSQQKQTPQLEASAMSRRRQELETDKLDALRNAEVAAAQLPEDQRQAVLPVLTQARLREQQTRGMA